MALRPLAAICVATAASLLGGLAFTGAQEPDYARTLAQSVAPPAIDRGVLDDGRVRGPDRRQSNLRLSNAVGDRQRRYVPGRVIVKFKSVGSVSTRSAVASLSRARVMARPSYADFEVAEIDPSLDPEMVATELAARADVEYAQAWYIVRTRYQPNDPLYGRQWNFRLIGMEQAWDINQGASASVIVAVLDSGVAFQNAIYQYTASSFEEEGVQYPALGRVSVPFAAAPELVGTNRFVAPRDFIWQDNAPVDLDGHGTHVAGTIGQVTNNNMGVAGMAFNVRLMPVKVVAGEWDHIFNSPEVGTDDIVARGIRYATDNGAKIINMSIGRDGPTAPAIGDAVRYAVSRGVFVAVAAGNDFERGNPIEAISRETASIDGCLVVAAVGPDSRRAYYSSVHDYVEIAAPGGNSRQGNEAGAIYQQTFDDVFTDRFLQPPSRYGPPRFDMFSYRAFQGTSMATPHVAGLAALLYTQGITSPQAIEAAIKRFATDQGARGRDTEYGAGIIDARSTLRGLGLIR